MSASHVYRHGPTNGPVVLALHGLTGHGKRWEHLATQHLPHARFLAPDLRGHGYSTGLPPWDFETIVADLLALLDSETDQPVVLLGHSFGGACALHLARTEPRRARHLVLLDPAIALEPERLNEIALATLTNRDYDSVAAARQDKLDSGWGDVPTDQLEAELRDHLTPSEDNRVRWRTSLPAVNSYWGQLARPFVLPPTDLRTTLVRATKVHPPFVTPEFHTALAEHLGNNLTTHEWDCDHMVAQAMSQRTAELLAAVL